MNYSEMSDFEINCAVAGVLDMRPWPELGYAGTQQEPFTAAICHGGGRLGGFDPCNSWADAGPIIERNGISIEFDGDNSTDQKTMWCHVTNMQRTCGVDYQKNPLRAAMIVFLMMQEANNA